MPEDKLAGVFDATDNSRHFKGDGVSQRHHMRKFGVTCVSLASHV